MEVSSNKKVVQKEKCPTVDQEELQMKIHILQNTLEKLLFPVDRTCGKLKQKKKQLLGGNLMKRVMAKN